MVVLDNMPPKTIYVYIYIYIYIYILYMVRSRFIIF